MIELHELTDDMIRSALRQLPVGHYARQWYIDAMGEDSPSHPYRRTNARREVAAAINARKETPRKETP